MEDEKIKTNPSRKFIVIYIVSIILVAVIAFLLGDMEHSTGDNNKSTDTYSVKYIGIDFDESCTYAYFDISSSYELNISATDFSVKIDNAPITANHIQNGTLFEFDIEVMNGTILVRFEKNKNELDTPITFYYKGVQLELGKAIEFN